eukprot:66542_1
MIQVAQMDWDSVRAHVKVIVDDFSINPQTFYEFINEAAEFANDEEISIVSAITNTHLRQKLAANAAKKLQPDHMWYAAVSTQFNQAKYLETMNVISEFNNGSIKRIPKLQLPTGPNINGNTRGNPQYRNNNGQSKEERQQFRTDLNQWTRDIKNKLKPEWLKKFKPTTFCYKHHKKGLYCKFNPQPSCETGGSTRSHSCLC